MGSSELPPVSGEAGSVQPLAVKPESPRRITVMVQNPDGTQASCGKRWVVTALKVLLAVVVIGSFVAASVFTFGAAGLFGAAAASAMGVTLASSGVAIGALYATGGVLVGATGALIRLAYKHRMGKYTGEDRRDAQRFLADGAQNVANIVKKALSDRIREFISTPVQSEQEIRKGVFRQVISEIGELEDVPLSKAAKEFLQTAFEKLQQEKRDILPKETLEVIDKVIGELKEEGRRNLSPEARDFISQAVGMREWQYILPQSIKEVVQDPQMVRQVISSV